MRTPDYLVPAFRKAQELARASHIAGLSAAPLDIHAAEDELWTNLHAVRKALIAGQVQQGAKILDKDPDSKKLAQLIEESQFGEDAFFELVNLREEAGYLYGLAIGLLLGRGGAR